MDPPEDPGGTVPEVGNVVTISNTFSALNEASMDTDSSVLSGRENGGKRKRLSKARTCKHCNKKRRRRYGDRDKLKENDCQCNDALTNTQIIPESFTKPHSQAYIATSSKNQGENEITTFTQKQVNLLDNTLPINSTTSQENNSPPPQPSPARLLYSSSDASPYVVHIQRNQQSPDDSTTLHPVSFGRFLKNNKIYGIVNGSLKRIGRNRLAVSFQNHSEANSFISNSVLETANYKAFVPSFSVTRMGIVRGVPAEWSDEEVKENISVPIGCGPILKIRRLKRKITINGHTELKTTESVVLTFDGQVLPKRIFMCFTSLLVDLYIYPTVQCYNCCRFGHVKVQCRSQPRCFRCGQGHSGDSCSVIEDDVCCCLCKGFHLATSKKCLEYERQTQIKKTMATSCISYAEASKQHSPISKISYADALLSTSNVPHTASGPQIEKSTSKDNSNISYKKTVFAKPRSPPRHSKGYDVEAHKSITRDYDMPSTSNSNVLNANNDLSNVSTIADLILALIKSLSQSNLINISPSNVASIFETLAQFTNFNNGSTSQGASVEQQKHHS